MIAKDYPWRMLLVAEIQFSHSPIVAKMLRAIWRWI